jgi:enterochelin esterase-like enzyme
MFNDNGKIQRYILLPFLVLMVVLFCGCVSKNHDLIQAGIPLPFTESRIVDFSLDSTYAERRIPCKMYLPRGYGDGKNYPVLYLLNSYGSTETMWIRAGITESADTLIDEEIIKPLVMVFPQTRDATSKEIREDMAEDGKFDERKMDQFIWKELVPYMDSHYNTITSRGGRFIGGMSMGGAIALRIAFHHPDLFGKVGGYTPAVTSSDYSGREFEKWLYPNADAGEIKDVKKFAQQKKLHTLSVYLDAGNSNDPFTTGVQSLHEALVKRGIQSEFYLYEGGHSLEHNKGDYRQYLRFFVAGDI